MVLESHSRDPTENFSVENHYNKKAMEFFCRFWNRGCNGVEFFVQNLWDIENCLAVPPV